MKTVDSETTGKERLLQMGRHVREIRQRLWRYVEEGKQ